MTRIKKTRLLAAGGALVATLAGAGLSAAPANALYNQTDAVAGQYPFFVNVGGWCGGALIDPEWVLTAEHCAATDDTLGKPMRVGYVSESEPGVTTIARQRITADFTDIGLIRVDPVTSVKPIVVQFPQVRNDDLVTVVANGGGSNGKLGSADFRVTDQPGPLNSSRNATNFTIQGLEPATNSCGGDSGSPIISTTADGPRLTGVLFAGAGGCDQPNGVTFAASPQTEKVWNWITSKIGKPVGEYRIYNANSFKVLDVDSRGHAVQKARTEDASQKWTFTKDVGQTPRPAQNPVNVRNVASGQLLGISGGFEHDGATAVQFPDVDVADQSWSLVAQPDGSYTIVNNNSGKVLGIPAGSQADGETAVQWQDLGVNDQKWILQRVG